MCNIALYLAKSITIPISALTGTHLFAPGWREAIIVKCLAQGHKVSRPGFEAHTLLNRSTRAWVRCSYPLGHDTLLCCTSVVVLVIGLLTFGSGWGYFSDVDHMLQSHVWNSEYNKLINCIEQLWLAWRVICIEQLWAAWRVRVFETQEYNKLINR